MMKEPTMVIASVSKKKNGTLNLRISIVKNKVNTIS